MSPGRTRSHAPPTSRPGVWGLPEGPRGDVGPVPVPTRRRPHDGRADLLTTFSTSSRRPQGADARRHRRTGRTALHSAPLRSAPGAALGWARTRQPGAADREVAQRHPMVLCLAGHPSVVAQVACRLPERRGLRIAPTAIMEVRPGTARVKGGLRPSQAIASRPLTRTAPNLRCAAIGAMRRTARALDTWPSPLDPRPRR
jgi:hypothetical protein